MDTHFQFYSLFFRPSETGLTSVHTKTIALERSNDLLLLTKASTQTAGDSSVTASPSPSDRSAMDFPSIGSSEVHSVTTTSSMTSSTIDVKSTKTTINDRNSESSAPKIELLPTAIALVGGPPLGHEKPHSEDSELDHNSLDELYKEPMYFGTENSTTITTQVGANAHLPCSVHNIGEGVVSTFQSFQCSIDRLARSVFAHGRMLYLVAYALHIIKSWRLK